MAKAPYRVTVGGAPLVGSGGIPPKNFLKFGCSKCHLVQSGGIVSVKIVFHLHNFIYHHFQ